MKINLVFVVCLKCNLKSLECEFGYCWTCWNKLHPFQKWLIKKKADKNK
jgi:hypothetical protein